MITVHSAESAYFTTSGYGFLDPFIMDAVITEVINADYQLTFTYPAEANLAQYLVPGNLVAAPVPATTVRQAFRITTVETCLGGLLRITALHISFDLAKVLIADTNIINRTPFQALTQIRTNANPANSFTFTTNVSHIRSLRIVRQSVLESLLDTSKDNTFASRYGGEFFRNNLALAHQQKLGTDKGITIRDRKNLTGYRATVDTSTILTRVLPVGFDGLMLPEKYVDSPRLTNYPAPLVGVMRFEHIKAAPEGEPPKEDELPLAQAHEALRQAVRDAYAAGLDLPVAAYEVNFIDLATTQEYAGVAKLERVNLGDTVTVIHSEFKANLQARVTGYSYDPLAKTYISLSLGSIAPSFTTTTRTVTRALETLSENTAAAHGAALAAQVSADGKNTIHYGAIQPRTAQIGDTWFKENGEKTEIWVYTLGTNNQPTWKSVASDINSSQIQADLDELEAALATVRSNVAVVDALAKATSSALNTTNTQVTAARAKADETARAHDALRLEFTSNKQSNEQALIAIRNDVLLRATKGELIAQINISPETILIDGKRIHITGTTSIDNAVIKTAMIADAAITNAKIQSLDAAKITTGYLAAARILAGSITSDKLTIANGFIKTAMIADAAIINAKIANLDAAKITTGTLNAGRIAARSITADKLAANAIQVGLAGWNQSIRISPTQLSWYNGTTLEGSITSTGMSFYYGTRHIGDMGRRAKKDAPTIQGIINHLAPGGDYTAWTFQETATSENYTYFTFDPKGRFYGQRGIHMGADLRTHGYKFFTAGNRFITLEDVTLGTKGTFPGWSVNGGRAQVAFTSNDLMIVTNNTYYSMTSLTARISELIMRMNSLISTFNRGWVQSIRDNGGGTVAWQSYSNTGLTTMPTTVT